MEGPLFIALAALGLWIYRRFFEPVAKSAPEFEAWSRTDPLLAAVRGQEAGSEAPRRRASWIRSGSSRASTRT